MMELFYTTIEFLGVCCAVVRVGTKIARLGLEYFVTYWVACIGERTLNVSGPTSTE